jgi:hypothetical protein
MMRGIVSRDAVWPEAQNEIAENILPPAGALLSRILVTTGGLARP